jgi:uncharacterized protein (TIGR03382 family)
VKKFALSALALVAFAGAANAQTIEFRWTERHGQTEIGPGALPIAGDTTSVGNGTDGTLLLFLEARVVGGNALGISTFGGNVVTNDPFNPTRNTNGSQQGFLSAAADASAPGTNVNNARSTAAFAPSYGAWVNGDGDPLPAGRGVFNPFRQVANLGNAANGILDDVDGTTPGLQTPATNSVINIFGNMAQADFDNNAGNNFGADGFIPLFIVRYDVTDLSARSLTFTYEGFVTAFSGFAGGLAVEAATVEGSTSYTVNIVPAPGAAALLGLGGLVALRRRRA